MIKHTFRYNLRLGNIPYYIPSLFVFEYIKNINAMYERNILEEINMDFSFLEFVKHSNISGINPFLLYQPITHENSTMPGINPFQQIILQQQPFTKTFFFYYRSR